MSASAGTKESELVMAVMLYAIRCLSENDQHALRNMNFGPEEVAALRELNLADLYRVGSLQAHCLDIRLDRADFVAAGEAFADAGALAATVATLEHAEPALE